MNQRFRVLQELGEQFERASEAADVNRGRSLCGTRLFGDRRGLAQGSRRLWAAIGAGGLALIAGIVMRLCCCPQARQSPTPGGPRRRHRRRSRPRPQCVIPRGSATGSQPSRGKLVLTDVRGRYIAVMYVSGIFVPFACQDGRPRGMVRRRPLILRFYAAPGPDQLGLPSGGSGALNGFSAPKTNQPLPEPFQRILHAIQTQRSVRGAPRRLGSYWPTVSRPTSTDAPGATSRLSHSRLATGSRLTPPSRTGGTSRGGPA